MKTILTYIKPYRLRMALGFCIKVLATLSELVLPIILSHILKEVVVTQDIYQILFWGAMMILFSAAACVLNIIANRMAAKVSRNFSEKLRHILVGALLVTAEVHEFVAVSDDAFPLLFKECL